MEENLQNSNMPQEGTPEYEQMMREAYGEEYVFQKRAEFLTRFWAKLIDAVLLILIYFGTYTLLYDENLLKFEFWVNLQQDKELASLFEERSMPIGLILTFIYLLFEVLLATSPGKALLSLKIANVDGSKATLMQLLTRALFKDIDTILGILLVSISMNISPFIYLEKAIFWIITIGYLLALSEKRQALQDIIAKTAVYKKSNLNLEN